MHCAAQKPNRAFCVAGLWLSTANIYQTLAADKFTTFCFVCVFFFVCFSVQNIKTYQTASLFAQQNTDSLILEQHSLVTRPPKNRLPQSSFEKKF